jgi:hypothetical protein
LKGLILKNTYRNTIYKKGIENINLGCRKAKNKDARNYLTSFKPFKYASRSFNPFKRASRSVSLKLDI